MVSATPHHKRIANFLTAYHQFRASYDDSSQIEESRFYAREIRHAKESLDNMGVFFHYTPLWGQKMNDCWYLAAQKIIWYHLKKADLLAEWQNKTHLSDGRLSPQRIWQRNTGLYEDERYVLKKFGLRPIPQQLFHYVQKIDYKCRWLPPDHPQQMKEVFQEKELRPFSYAELRQNLERLGPLWVSLSRFGSASHHASVVVGVGKDCVILNDSSRSKKNPEPDGRIIVITIEDFNKYLNGSENEPIWYCPTPQWAGHYTLA